MRVTLYNDRSYRFSGLLVAVCSQEPEGTAVVRIFWTLFRKHGVANSMQCDARI
jgi:hypothetical protein